MPRGLHVDSIAELETDGQYLFHLIEFEFDAGTERFTDAHKDIVFNSNTYLADARFKSFGDVVETQSLELSSMRFTVSGVDQTALAAALLNDTVNRKVNLYQGLLDTSNYTVINTPTIIYSGRIKSHEFKETPGGTASLTWNTASVLADFDRTAGRRSNHQDQESYIAIRGLTGPDYGFEFAHQITPDLRWGRP